MIFIALPRLICLKTLLEPFTEVHIYIAHTHESIDTTDVSLHITGIITLLAEKLNTTIITERHNDGLVSRETAAAIEQAQQENQHFLRIPRRFVSITDLF